jgi:hypothetical protein
VTLTGVTDRAGVHDSAVRRYFSSHEEGVEIRRTSPAAEISLADAIEQALPVLGTRAH